MSAEGDRQRKFTKMFGKLILWAYQQGYELTFGDGYRDPRVYGEWGEDQGYGHEKSFHKRRLAHDINLFIDGKYQTTTEAHLPLGEQWEKMGGTWGGRFSKPDGNHYSYGESR